MINEPTLLSNIALHSANVRIHSATHQKTFSLHYTKSEKDLSVDATINPLDDVASQLPSDVLAESWKIMPKPDGKI